MFDKELYKDTFSVLKASETTLTEVMKMKNKSKKRISPKVMWITAAVLVGLLSTTALAYGGTIINFVRGETQFGDSTVTQIDWEDWNNRDFSDYDVANGIRIVNRIAVQERDWESEVQGTFEQVNAAMPFEVAKPSYVPFSGGEFTFTGDAGAYRVNMSYRRGNASISLTQYFAGPDATLEIENPLEMATFTMLDGVEGLAFFYEYDNPDDAGDEHVQIWWVNGGNAFTLQAYGFEYDLDTLIKIAESL
jgi:hypothetical protein